MHPCDCSHRPAFFDIHPDEIASFLARFERLTSDRLKIYHLYRCPACGSLWIVDDMTRGPMAVRASSASEIDSFDERPYRRKLAIAMHGGLSESKCMFARCGNRALSGIVFCVDHQYPEYTLGDASAE